MATIEPYQTAAGKRYRVRYRKPDKTQTDKRGFKTKREAEIFAASVTVSKATGEYIDPALARVTVSQLGPTWLAGKKTVVKPSQYAALDGAWRTHVDPVWGDRELRTIQPSEVQQWVAKLGAGRSATVVLRAHGVLAGILDLAVADRRLPRNPARGVQLPRKKKTGRVYLTHEQVHELAAASKYPTLLLTLAYTGLRWGELSALRVKHVNALKRRLSVEENAVWVGSTVHVGTPKTHEMRSVPFPKFLGPQLAELCKGKGPDALLFGDGINHMRQPHPSHSWLAKALRDTRAAQQKLIDKAIAENREPEVTLTPLITAHDLRHTAASLAISTGANPKAVQRMLGHASAAMTLDTYADLFDDDLDGVANRMQAAAVTAAVGKPWGHVVGA